MQKRFLTLLFLFLLAGVSAFAAEDAPSRPRKGLIADWLIAGPYPSYVVNGKDTGLHQDPLGGEAAIRPQPGQKDKAVFKADVGKLIAALGSVNEWGFKADQTIPVEWKVHRFAKPELIAIDDMFRPITDHFIYYAACYIESPEDRPIQLRIGSDDYHKVYLNGEVVGSRESCQGVRANDFIYMAKLKRGMNFLLLKVVDCIMGTGFCLAIYDRADHPMDDLLIRTESPAGRLGADVYDKGFAAKVQWGKQTLYAGEACNAAIRFHAPDDRAYVLQIGAKQFQAKNLGVYSLTITPGEGKSVLVAEVLDKGRRVAVLEVPFAAYSRSRLRKQTEQLKRETAQIDLQIAQEKSRKQELSTRLAEAKKSLSAARLQAEAKFLAEREKALAGAEKSEDSPAPKPFAGRSRLCINGVWKTGYRRDTLNSEMYLPGPMFANFFRSWFLPLVPKDTKQPHSTKMLPVEGWEDFQFNELHCREQMWARREFDCDDLSKQVFFVCESVVGRLEVYCNGTFCGSYDGTVGIVEIPLANLRVGKNTLELKYRMPEYPLAINHNYPACGRGIHGDCFLDFVSPVRVASVGIRTGWRDGRLQVSTELENRTGRAATCRLETRVVGSGRTKLCLPARTGIISPQSKVEWKNEKRWNDPRLWSLADPYLYTLVSDLYVDGKLVDRHTEPFGFREFWIHAIDFYFNGKRIILQGDVGHSDWSNAKYCDVAWPLYRADGINILRGNDPKGSEFSPARAKHADRYGMLIYAQMYAVLDLVAQTPTKFTPLEQFRKHPVHQWNLENYRRWYLLLRNHPSVVIWSTDNEVFSQSKDSVDRRKLNIRNETLASEYRRYVQSLDSSLVTTRDGDIGTWNRHQTFFENPPCPTANYHYADFNLEQWAHNWQEVYQYRPVIFGETLYCSYGAWDRWCGAKPDIVATKAAKIRQVATLYRQLEIPAQMYMGLGLDGFVELRPDGKGSPWHVAELSRHERKAPGWRKGTRPRDYPWIPLEFPARSGLGWRMPARLVGIDSYGDGALNWSSSRHVSHVRNAVNDAYRDSLLPQPPLPAAMDAECVVNAAPGRPVWVRLREGSHYGVVADANGKAWLQLDRPGRYPVSTGGRTREIEIPSRASYAAQPGFDQVKVIDFKEQK
ncbi:MAG: glycoside hydrolase family 2 TIM barrel-domain containing protein [Victivallaceae bacterium]|nr:glycoside hydrolase family 2 TIM barrel-domain containing protein [Victivallaceae bacterium]